MKPILFAMLAWSTAAAAAPLCTRQSPAHTVALVELYTSEGCSSCPPADLFLRGLRSGLGVGDEQAVALSLHVDYWNSIGWKDPYSSATFTQRQRWLSDLAHSTTIYTPEYFVGGKELRNWSGGMADAVKRVNATPAQASIGIVLGTANGPAIPVEVKATANQPARLHLALVESAIESRVRAGENSGRTLFHDHVVRAWLAPVDMSAGTAVHSVRVLSAPTGAQAAKLGVVAFVQTARGDVLQALSLPACR